MRTPPALTDRHWRLSILLVTALLSPARASSQESGPEQPGSAQEPRERRTPGFELGLGVGATRLTCVTACAHVSHFSAGPLLVFGFLIHPRIFVGGQIAGTALDDDLDDELSAWAVMPVAKFYPTRDYYIGAAIGYGEAEGTIEGGHVKQGLLSSEFRVAWTMPWNRAITPYVSVFRPLQSLRVDHVSGNARVRAESYQLGVALSTPGAFLARPSPDR